MRWTTRIPPICSPRFRVELISGFGLSKPIHKRPNSDNEKLAIEIIGRRGCAQTERVDGFAVITERPKNDEHPVTIDPWEGMSLRRQTKRCQIENTSCCFNGRLTERCWNLSRSQQYAKASSLKNYEYSKSK